MSGRDDGGPAFPVHPDMPARLGCINAESDAGMTLRDYFAAKAMVGLLAEPVSPGIRSSVRTITQRDAGPSSAAAHFAEAAYMLADAMLAERAK